MPGPRWRIATTPGHQSVSGMCAGRSAALDRKSPGRCKCSIRSQVVRQPTRGISSVTAFGKIHTAAHPGDRNISPKAMSIRAKQRGNPAPMTLAPVPVVAYVIHEPLQKKTEDRIWIACADVDHTDVMRSIRCCGDGMMSGGASTRMPVNDKAVIGQVSPTHHRSENKDFLHGTVPENSVRVCCGSACASTV